MLPGMGEGGLAFGAPKTLGLQGVRGCVGRVLVFGMLVPSGGSAKVDEKIRLLGQFPLTNCCLLPRWAGLWSGCWELREEWIMGEPRPAGRLRDTSLLACPLGDSYVLQTSGRPTRGSSSCQPAPVQPASQQPPPPPSQAPTQHPRSPPGLPPPRMHLLLSLVWLWNPVMPGCTLSHGCPGPLWGPLLPAWQSLLAGSYALCKLEVDRVQCGLGLLQNPHICALPAA